MRTLFFGSPNGFGNQHSLRTIQVKLRVRGLLYLAQSSTQDHGLAVRTGTDVLNLLNFSNYGAGQHARPPTLTPTNFSMYC
jgi:hypothetical protein